MAKKESLIGMLMPGLDRCHRLARCGYRTDFLIYLQYSTGTLLISPVSVKIMHVLRTSEDVPTRSDERPKSKNSPTYLSELMARENLYSILSLLNGFT